MKGIAKTYTYFKRAAVLCCALLFVLIGHAQNDDIVAENNKAGNPKSEWDLTGGGAGDFTILGFATDISYNKGQRVRFKIKTDASAYTINVYRMGYYDGDGARKVGTGVITATLPQTQPNPIEDAATGLTDCGNWAESAYWDIPANACSGVYIAKLTRTDNGGASHIIFVVRNDGNTSKLFFQTSDATWQAYNPYGGNSLYTAAGPLPNGHASKVSYNRPYITRSGGGGGTVGEDWFFNSEYPMIRFLEKFGYEVSYTTNVDAARRGNEILLHKVFMSVGHDEYWSAEQRNSVEAARNAGVNLAFFSGNEVYWKTRWENSLANPSDTYRTIVCYKEGDQGELVCGTKCDPNPTVWTGLWRGPQTAPFYDAGKPENALSGQASWQGGQGAMTVPAAYKNLRIWRNTNITSLGSEAQATFPLGTLGYEWNYEQMPEANPPGRFTMSSTTIGGKTHKLSMYRHSSGALVFGAGTIQWAWGLDANHDGAATATDTRMQQATINVLADMGVQPPSNVFLFLLAGLTRTSQTTDATPPTSNITSHANGGLISIGQPATISGTSTDAGGGVVAAIEISIDGGATWKPANGTTNWSYTFTSYTEGPITVKVRGVDDSGRMENPGSSGTNVRNLNVGFPTPPPCPCTIFNTSDAPTSGTLQDDPNGIELGVKFKSNINGYITGIRFYKTTGNSGTHTGSLWSTTGTLLTQAVFINETASGWQEVRFNTPVAITAGTTYIASYHSSNGYYAESVPYFSNPKIKNPLIAAAASPSSPNGVYLYTSTPAFPTSATANGNNYFVDIVLNTSITPDTTPPVVLSTTPVNGASSVPLSTAITAHFNEPMNPATLTASQVELKDAANNIYAVTTSYNTGTYSVTITPTIPLSNATVYTVTVKGGASGAKDASNNALASNYAWSFTTAGAPAVEGPGGPILVISSGANPFSRYPVEILRAEGLNEFRAEDLSMVTASELNNYDVVILGDVFVNATQATMFTNWVNAGGKLIAFKPNSSLNTLFGLNPTGGTLSDKYLAINNSGPGVGIVNQTIQFHSTANLYTLTGGATALAMLYSDAVTATTNPAVTRRSVGSNGGVAIAYAFDLARSIVYTRQGNPAWVGQKRDGTPGATRSDDLYFGGNSDPDYVDFNKITIPQADEQQRFLTNIILQNNLGKRPLPRFWFLPSGHKAAIVMTGDDHANNGTEGRFNQYKTMGPNTPADVTNWTAVRGSSYLFNNTPISLSTVQGFIADGFEIGLHVNTGCFNQTESQYEATLQQQLADFAAQFPGIPAPNTSRTHCIVWNDWASVAKVQARNGIRLDVNYYYWPAEWVNDRPGLFTGSAMPMRFADADGSVIDCYQVVTQLTDESNISYTPFTNALLDKAVGTEGYYGVFATNMHTDENPHAGSDAIIASAQAHNVPIVSAKQMLTWLDGRNNSSFSAITWNANTLSFTVTAAPGSTNMKGMIPYTVNTTYHLISLTRGGSAATFTRQVIKGMEYAFFDATGGNYVATYAQAGNLIGNITLLGRGSAPSANWQISLRVELFQGTNSTPVQTFNVTTDNTGKFTIPNIPEGVYRIGVKKTNSLRNIKNWTIVSGDNTINFDTIRDGDINDDNVVDITDFSFFLNTFNKTVGNPGYDARADFNGDNFVDITDFSLFLNYFNTMGDNNP